MKYIVYDCYKEEDNGIHAEFNNRDDALRELSRTDIDTDGFYLVSEDNEN